MVRQSGRAVPDRLAGLPAPRVPAWAVVRLRVPARLRPPARTGPIIAATLVLSIGKGAFLSTVMVYLLEIARLSPLAATTTLSLWGAASVVVAVPVGMLVDRTSGRVVGAANAAVAALLIALTARASAGTAVMALVCLAGGFDSAANVTRRALLAGAARDGVAALAWGRTVSNVGFALGGLWSVHILSTHTRSGYASAYLLAGIGYLVMALFLSTTSLGRGTARGADPVSPDAGLVPPDAASAGNDGWRRHLRTGAALATTTGILLVHSTLLTAILPLWISRYASVPVATLGWLVLLNSVVVIAGQIPVSSLATTTAGAIRCFHLAAWCIAASCALLGLVRFGSPGWQLAALVAATLALTVGELFQAAGEWGLSAILASAGGHGFYQGACVFGESAQASVGPLLVGGLVTALPLVGWLVLIGVVGAGRYLTRFVVPPAGMTPPPALP
jgi:hypothetical protein